MKKKLLVLLAVAALFATVIAAPAAAGERHALRGHQDLNFNVGIVYQEGAAPNVSWVGTVEFRGGTYDIVYYPAPLVHHGDWVYFEEDVVIYEADSVIYEFDGNGVITEFQEGNLVVAFSDKGWGSPWGTAFAWGEVTATEKGANSHGVLNSVDVGDRIFWSGSYLDDAHMTFGGPFRIFRKG